MSHKFKVLGVSVVAVLALSAVVTSISAAAQFTASTYPTTYEPVGNEGTGEFLTEAGASRCKHITAAGTLLEASSTVAVSTSYSECTSFGLPSTVKMEGCEYLLHVSSGSADTYTGSGDIVCPEGKKVIGTIATCEIQIPAQAGAVSIEFINNTAESYIEGNITASKVHYTVTKDNIGCPFKGTGTKTDGKIAHAQPGLVGGSEKPAVID